jgi:hypothetical protein
MSCLFPIFPLIQSRHRFARLPFVSLPEAKMVLESYHAQQNLAMSASFTAAATAGTRRQRNARCSTPLGLTESESPPLRAQAPRLTEGRLSQ